MAVAVLEVRLRLRLLESVSQSCIRSMVGGVRCSKQTESGRVVAADRVIESKRISLVQSSTAQTVASE